MSESRTVWELLPRPLREFPADLAIIGGVVGATILTVLTSGLQESPLRIALGLVFVLFAPGYALVAALFPEAGPSRRDGTEHGTAKRNGDARERSTDRPAGTALTGLERLALSIGFSIVLVTLCGLGASHTPLGVEAGPIVVALGVGTVLLIGTAAVRRTKLDAEDRFRVPYREWYGGTHSALFEPDTATDVAVNVLVAIAVVSALAAGGYATAASPENERFSAIYLLTEDDDGTLVTDDYPAELESGESRQLVVGIDNNEQRPVTYTLVVAEQRVDTDGDETTITGQNELDRFETQVGSGETWRTRYDLEPTMAGDVRIVWLLYADSDVPSDPSLENADYSTQLWMTVSDDADS